ncbi:MAG TPA: hypothetical protein VG078_00755 [Acidimicrobiales bacterium]|nr:hypothetical protein [Acidimicrobiales bacterium]
MAGEQDDPGAPAGSERHSTIRPAGTAVERKRRQGAAVAIAGAGIVALGAFLPWAKLTAPFVGTVSTSGMEGGDGVFFLVMAAGVGLIAANAYRSAPERPARYRIAMAALVVGLLLLTVVEVLDLRSRFSEASEQGAGLIRTSYGTGIWLVAIGSGVTALAWVRIPWAAPPDAR